MDDAERGVAVLHAVGDDPQCDEVVDLLELDLLPLQFLADAPQTLDAAVDLDDRHFRLGELGGDRVSQLFDQALCGAALGVHLDAERLVGLRLEVLERELLELVLDLAHAEAIRDRRVDVARLLRNLDPLVVGKVTERPHVVQAIGELDENHADVVDHRQQHLAEGLGLPLLAGREGDGADLGDAFDDVSDFGPEQLTDAFDGGERVLDDVVEEPGGDGHGVQPHVGEEIGDRERVNQVRFTRVAHLSLVLEGRKDVGPPEQFDVGVGAVGPDFFQQILEANHEKRCLNLLNGCQLLSS